MPEPGAFRPTWRSPHEAVVDLTGQAEPVLVRLHFHPGWDVGGGATVTQDPVGWIQLTELRNSTQPLVMSWEGTGPQHWGERLGVVGLFASAAGIFFLAFRDRRLLKVSLSGYESERYGKLMSARLSSGLAPGSMVGCVLLFVVARTALDRSRGGPFLLHSPPGNLAFSVESQPATIGDA